MSSEEIVRSADCTKEELERLEELYPELHLILDRRADIDFKRSVSFTSTKEEEKEWYNLSPLLRRHMNELTSQFPALYPKIRDMKAKIRYISGMVKTEAVPDGFHTCREANFYKDLLQKEVHKMQKAAEIEAIEKEWEDYKKRRGLDERS